MDRWAAGEPERGTIDVAGVRRSYWLAVARDWALGNGIGAWSVPAAEELAARPGDPPVTRQGGAVSGRRALGSGGSA